MQIALITITDNQLLILVVVIVVVTARITSPTHRNSVPGIEIEEKRVWLLTS